ncbi:MAG TPA: hypothetical protein VFR08_02750, partial [Candidatus Angelobacter sp.]|nr:hypothetical protein [Candidatus Angelobacter sp.]
MLFFFLGLSLVCAGTLAYEIVLTRLLSAMCWYYLAFVSISMAMFGMTAGALVVQLRKDFFRSADNPRRLSQAAFAMAASMPITLLVMFAVPLDISFAVQTFFSFLIFSAVIAVPFFFSGITVCLALTKSEFAIGRVYSADLIGAAAGCVAAVLLLTIIDAPSAILAISVVLFMSAACFAAYANQHSLQNRAFKFAAFMLLLTALNASTLHGIQPIWTKGTIDRRDKLAAEVWNPISKVRAFQPETRPPMMWGPSPVMPDTQVREIRLDIDNDAATPMTYFAGDLSSFTFLRYDVTSIGAQLRAGGSAAIIGVGGGRDVMNCALNRFHRIIGIEVNSAILTMDTRKFLWFSGFNKIPGFEVHNDEGRSYLTRAAENFDLIQASLVDTWAATSAGALTLSENSLYTVDGWRIFYDHLKPGGLITFSRWYSGPEAAQTYRLFSVAWGMLLSEGVAFPGQNILLLSSGRVATILVSNQPLIKADLSRIEDISRRMQFNVLFSPQSGTAIPELQTISSAKALPDLMRLRQSSEFDYSPVFDTSPYFFNAVRLRNVLKLVMQGGHGSNLRALLFVFVFMLAAIVLVITVIVLPLQAWSKTAGTLRPSRSGITYFIAIGIGFILVEMAMLQQLSVFLGHPIYALVVVLSTVILSTGIGSLVSDALKLRSRLAP